MSMRGSYTAAWEVIPQRLTQPLAPCDSWSWRNTNSCWSNACACYRQRSPLVCMTPCPLFGIAGRQVKCDSEEATKTRHQCLPMASARSMRDMLKPNAPLLSTSNVSLCLRYRCNPTILRAFRSTHFVTSTIRVSVRSARATLRKKLSFERKR